MSWRRSAWKIAAIMWATTARFAHAQSIESIELRVTPDARGCITEAALRARIASLHVQVDGSFGLAFEIDASSEPTVVEVRRNDVVVATRRFEALPERCSDRLQTVALVIALAIEHAVTPEADAVVPDAPPEPDAAPMERKVAPVESAPQTQPAPPAPVESDDDVKARFEPAFRTVVGVGAAYGLLPEVAGVLAASIELPSSALRIGVGALVTSETSTALAGGTALTRLAGARAYGCAGGEGWALDLQGCAGLALGFVSGRGRDYAPGADATGTLLAPLVRLSARYPAHGWLSAGFSLEGFANLVRPELQVSGNAGAVSSSPLFGASLSLEGVVAVP